MRIECDCLKIRNEATGLLEPLVIECEDEHAPAIDKLRTAAYATGLQLRSAFNASVFISGPDANEHVTSTSGKTQPISQNM